MFAYASSTMEASPSTTLSVHSSNNSDKSCSKFHCNLSLSVSVFCFCLGLAPGLHGSYGVYADFVFFAGAGVEFSRIESCHTDVEGVVSALQVERPVDKPGTTTSTLFSVLQCIFLPFSIRCVF